MIEITKNSLVRFSWKFKRLTLRQNPPIYHWLWFNIAISNGQEYIKFPFID